MITSPLEAFHSTFPGDDKQQCHVVMLVDFSRSKIKIIRPWVFNHSNPLRWRHNECDSVSNHQPHDCLLNRLFRRISKKTSKLRVTGLCAGNSPGTGEFPAQMASYAENISIWWRHHAWSCGYPYFQIDALACIVSKYGWDPHGFCPRWGWSDVYASGWMD